MKTSIFKKSDEKQCRKRLRSDSFHKLENLLNGDLKLRRNIFVVNHDDLSKKKERKTRGRKRKGQENEAKNQKDVVSSREQKSSGIIKENVQLSKDVLDFDRILSLAELKTETFCSSEVKIQKSTIPHSAEVTKFRKGTKSNSNKKTLCNSDKIKYHTKKQKNKANKNNADLYNIDNFVVQSNTIKITQKSEPMIKIPVPKFTEIKEEDFYMCDTLLSDEEDDPSDETYIKLHEHFENKEREYRIKYYSDNKKKKAKKSQKAEVTQISNSESHEGINLKFKIEINRNPESLNDEMTLVL